MKIAILSDIHGNYPALTATIAHLDRWRPDLVVVAGDIVNRGPRSAECLSLIQEMQSRCGWRTVIGNHEEYVINQSAPDCPTTGPLGEIQRPSRWTFERLNRDVSVLRAMPYVIELPGPNSGDVRITHASMLGTRDGVYKTTPDHELIAKVGQPRPALFCVGHTHQPLVREVDGVQVVNAGAVGLPFDGDWRASYAQTTWQAGGWRARIARLEYDRRRAEQDFYDTGFLEEGGALAQLILRELQLSIGLIYSWAKEFEKSVLDGELTLEQSVALFLARFTRA